MFQTIGLKENIKNFVSLCKPSLIVTNRQDLKNSYRNFLDSAQPTVPRNSSVDIDFIFKRRNVEVLLKIFEEESALDDFEAIFDSEDFSSSHELSVSRVKESLMRMQKIAPSYYDLMHLAINTIFFAPSKLAGGGSTSAAIGCIWANLRLHWQDEDVLEFLVHETTHNLVFLDELCYTHYNDYAALPKKENFSWSAILNKPRPLDKVFHSIIVSTEILVLRNQLLGHPQSPCLHPPTEIMLEQTKHSIFFLRERPNLCELLSKRANFLLSVCEDKLSEIEKKNNFLQAI